MNKKLVNWKLVSILLGLALTISLLTLAYSQTTPTTPLYLSGGVQPGAPDYTVWSEGTTYFVKDIYGHRLYDGNSNASLVINSLMSTSKIILLEGSISITNNITVNYDNITIYGHAVLTMAASSNVDMFTVTGNNTRIKDLTLRGNRLNQASGHGIGQLNAYNCRYESLDIREFRGDGIFIQGVGTFGNNWITNCKIVDLDGNGIRLYLTVDDFIQNCDIGGVGGNCIEAVSSGSETISNNKIYMAGWNSTASAYNITAGGIGLHLYDASLNILSSNTIRSCGLEGIRLEYGLNNTLNANLVSYNDYAQDGRSGIVLAYTNFTNIMGGCSGNFEQNVVPKQEIGMNITYSIYNVVIGLQAMYNTLYGIINDGGATNQVHLCYNQTSWVS